MNQIPLRSPNSWPERLTAQGQIQHRGGNQPLRLDDPTQAWLVRVGQVELFLVSLDADRTEGARHHLATVVAGGLLLGIAADELADFALLAVPHVDTELLELPFAALATESSAADVIPALAPALEIWLRALSSGMARWATPRPHVDYGLGDLATRVMAITRIQSLVSTSSIHAILSGIFGFFSFGLMFFYDTRLALWAALLTLVYVLILQGAGAVGAAHHIADAFDDHAESIIGQHDIGLAKTAALLLSGLPLQKVV